MARANLSRTHPIVLVTGGTGGHVFPAEALAGKLRNMGYTLALFTDRRGQAWTGSLREVATHPIRAGRVTGVAFAARVKGAFDLALGGLQSRLLLSRLAPSVVVGFGGYTSVPTLMAATSLGLPTVVHEQNALLGRANRVLAPRVSAIATSFPEVRRLREEDLPKVVFTGNPVREAVSTLRGQPYQAPERGREVRILVTGGSQGASIFSRVVPGAIVRLPPELRGRIRLAQQCREEDMEKVAETYRRAGFSAELAPFFEDLARRLGEAHLVICRAGASTVAELTAAGRPATLIPYGHAADDHQTVNARAVADRGGAELIPEGDFTPEVLSGRLKLLLDQPGRLTAMATAARAAGHRDAAGNLAILTTGLIPMNDAGGNGRQAA